MFAARTSDKKGKVRFQAFADTREKAARIVFDLDPKAKTASTSIAYKAENEKEWRDVHRDIRWINRRDLPETKKNPRRPKRGREIVREAYVGIVEAGSGFLLGGVKKHTSTPFETEAEANAWLQAILQGNKEASRNVARSYVSPAKVYRAKKNPTGKFVIVGHAPQGQFYYRASANMFEDGKRGLERATRYKSRGHAERVAEELTPKLPAKLKNLLVEVFR